MDTAITPPRTPLPETLSTRAHNALARFGITTVEQVVEAYPEGLLKIPGFGRASLRDVEAALFPWQRYTPPRRPRGRLPNKSKGPVLPELYFGAITHVLTPTGS